LAFGLQIYMSEAKYMRFTPKIDSGTALCGIAVMAVAGLIGWSGIFSPAPASITTENPFAAQGYFQVRDAILVTPAVDMALSSEFQAAMPGQYQLVSSWYKNKHWWKRNAPIIGGAGGGALIGGLAGGGTGALIGGAAGGGAGYLYKRHRSHHHHYYH
jgi:hypothetical protein